MNTKIYNINNFSDLTQLLSVVNEDLENKILKNCIIDLSSSEEVNLDTLAHFKELFKLYKKNKQSLVLVMEGINYNKVPSSMHVVPTVTEAHDIIEMEEIERDLGF